VIEVLVGDQDRVGPLQGVRAAEGARVDDQDRAVFGQPDAGVRQLGELHRSSSGVSGQTYRVSGVSSGRAR
jgi:hypothetical protein